MSRVLVYCFALLLIALGMVLSLFFLRNSDGLREDAVLTAIAAGKLIAVFKKPISPLIKKICFGE